MSKRALYVDVSVDAGGDDAVAVTVTVAVAIGVAAAGVVVGVAIAVQRCCRVLIPTRACEGEVP